MNARCVISVTLYAEGQLVGSQSAQIIAPWCKFSDATASRLAGRLCTQVNGEAKTRLAELAAEEAGEEQPE